MASLESKVEMSDSEVLGTIGEVQRMRANSEVMAEKAGMSVDDYITRLLTKAEAAGIATTREELTRHLDSQDPDFFTAPPLPPPRMTAFEAAAAATAQVKSNSNPNSSYTAAQEAAAVLASDRRLEILESHMQVMKTRCRQY